MLRLKTRSQFQAVLAASKLATTAHFALHHLAPERPSPSPETAGALSDTTASMFVHSDLWVAPLIPKRWAKRAVTRNAIKRQVFSVARDFQSVLPVGAYVVRLRAGFVKAKFPSASSDTLKQAVRSELVQLLAKIAHNGASMAPRGLTK